VRGFWEDHLGGGDAAFAVCFVSGAQTGHQDGFGAAAGGYAASSLRSVE
jgi:hypothetical protein